MFPYQCSRVIEGLLRDPHGKIFRSITPVNDALWVHFRTMQELNTEVGGRENRSGGG